MPEATDQDQPLEEFHFASDEDAGTPPKERKLQKNIVQNVVTSFRDIHMLRKHYINEAKNSLLEVRRAKKDMLQAIDTAQKWENELDDAIETIPEFSEEKYEDFDYDALVEKANLPAEEIEVEDEEELQEQPPQSAKNR